LFKTQLATNSTLHDKVLISYLLLSIIQERVLTLDLFKSIFVLLVEISVTLLPILVELVFISELLLSILLIFVSTVPDKEFKSLHKDCDCKVSISDSIALTLELNAESNLSCSIVQGVILDQLRLYISLTES
jgi:hypothetical protein